MAKITVQQAITLIPTVIGAVEDGKVAIEDIIDFLESKGVDTAQLAANRALLQGDVDSITAELVADGAEQPPHFEGPPVPGAPDPTGPSGG